MTKKRIRVSQTLTNREYHHNINLRYFKHHSKEQHVVVIDLGPGMDICPDVYRYDTIDEARKKYKSLRDRWLTKGYEITQPEYY